MARPPLGLSVELKDASGVTTRLSHSDPDAGRRPQGINFKTLRDYGFADAGFTLARRIDRDYVDLGLLDSCAFVGDDGSVAYEGRLGAMPRSLDAGHSINVQLAGWMSVAKLARFEEIYVDRDLSQWSAPSRAHRAALLGAGYNIQEASVGEDPDNSQAALIQPLRGPWAVGQIQVVWSMYDPGAQVDLGALYYDFTGNTGDTDFNWRISASDTDDRSSGVETSADLQAASGSGTYTPATARRYMMLQHEHTAGSAGTDGKSYEVHWRNLAVYGNHGLETHSYDPSEPDGIYVTDALRDIAQRFCPKLNTDGVQDSTYAVGQLVFRDRLYPHDAWLELDKLLLWELAVWENQTLHYAPADLTKADWEVRLSEVKVNLQGDSTEDLANGIEVEYENVQTRRKEVLLPSDHDELRDDSVENPANRHGDTVWTAISLSNPTTVEDALQMGRAALAEFNSPKAPGTIEIVGHVRDGAGHFQQAWKPRCGETITIIDDSGEFSSRPRLITDTDYSHDGYRNRISVDSSAKVLDAYIDRLSTALAARNL